MKGEGTLLWLRIKGYPLWPALSVNLEHVPDREIKKVQAARKSDDKCLIFTFGDHMFFWASKTDLKPFRKHFEDFSSQQSTNKHFSTALREALEEESSPGSVSGIYLKCAVVTSSSVSLSPPLKTHQPPPVDGLAESSTPFVGSVKKRKVSDPGGTTAPDRDGGASEDRRRKVETAKDAGRRAGAETAAVARDCEETGDRPDEVMDRSATATERLDKAALYAVESRKTGAVKVAGGEAGSGETASGRVEAARARKSGGGDGREDRAGDERRARDDRGARAAGVARGAREPPKDRSPAPVLPAPASAGPGRPREKPRPSLDAVAPPRPPADRPAERGRPRTVAAAADVERGTVTYAAAKRRDKEGGEVERRSVAGGGTHTRGDIGAGDGGGGRSRLTGMELFCQYNYEKVVWKNQGVVPVASPMDLLAILLHMWEHYPADKQAAYDRQAAELMQKNEVPSAALPETTARASPAERPAGDEDTRGGGDSKKRRREEVALVRDTSPGPQANHDYCDTCGDGGGPMGLVCCVGCPGAYHPRCLRDSETPPSRDEETLTWLCASCRQLRREGKPTPAQAAASRLSRPRPAVRAAPPPRVPSPAADSDASDSDALAPLPPSPPPVPKRRPPPTAGAAVETGRRQEASGGDKADRREARGKEGRERDAKESRRREVEVKKEGGVEVKKERGEAGGKDRTLAEAKREKSSESPDPAAANIRRSEVLPTPSKDRSASARRAEEADDKKAPTPSTAADTDAGGGGGGVPAGGGSRIPRKGIIDVERVSSSSALSPMGAGSASDRNRDSRYPPNSRVYVKYTSEKITERDLHTALSKFGTLCLAPIMKRGYAFIQFTTAEEAKKAVEAGETSINNMRVVIAYANSGAGSGAGTDVRRWPGGNEDIRDRPASAAGMPGQGGVGEEADLYDPEERVSVKARRTVSVDELEPPYRTQIQALLANLNPAIIRVLETAHHTRANVDLRYHDNLGQADARCTMRLKRSDHEAQEKRIMGGEEHTIQLTMKLEKDDICKEHAQERDKLTWAVSMDMEAADKHEVQALIQAGVPGLVAEAGEQEVKAAARRSAIVRILRAAVPTLPVHPSALASPPPFVPGIHLAPQMGVPPHPPGPPAPPHPFHFAPTFPNPPPFMPPGFAGPIPPGWERPLPFGPVPPPGLFLAGAPPGRDATGCLHPMAMHGNAAPPSLHHAPPAGMCHPLAHHPAGHAHPAIPHFPPHFTGAGIPIPPGGVSSGGVGGWTSLGGRSEVPDMGGGFGGGAGAASASLPPAKGDSEAGGGPSTAVTSDELLNKLLGGGSGPSDGPAPVPTAPNPAAQDSGGSGEGAGAAAMDLAGLLSTVAGLLQKTGD